MSELTKIVWRVSARNSDGPWSVIVIADDPAEAFEIAVTRYSWFIKDGASIVAEEALSSPPKSK